MSIKETLRQAVELYTGRRVAAMATKPDPEVDGVYAVRVEFRSGTPVLDFIARGVRSRTAQEIADELEEVVFTVWPPTSRGRPLN